MTYSYAMLLEVVIKRCMDQIDASALAIYIDNELKCNQPKHSAKKQKKRLPFEVVTF